MRAHPFQLTLRNPVIQDKKDLWFRYDPPVVIIVITWYQTQVKFGHFLYNKLQMSYFNNKNSVSNLSV